MKSIWELCVRTHNENTLLKNRCFFQEHYEEESHNFAVAGNTAIVNKNVSVKLWLSDDEVQHIFVLLQEGSLGAFDKKGV